MKIILTFFWHSFTFLGIKHNILDVMAWWYQLENEMNMCMKYNVMKFQSILWINQICYRFCQTIQRISAG